MNRKIVLVGLALGLLSSTAFAKGDEAQYSDSLCIKNAIEAALAQTSFADLKIKSLSLDPASLSTIKIPNSYNGYSFIAEDAQGNSITGNSSVKIKTVYEDRTGKAVGRVCEVVPLEHHHQLWRMQLINSANIPIYQEISRSKYIYEAPDQLTTFGMNEHRNCIVHAIKEKLKETTYGDLTIDTAVPSLSMASFNFLTPELQGFDFFASDIMRNKFSGFVTLLKRPAFEKRSGRLLGQSCEVIPQNWRSSRLMIQLQNSAGVDLVKQVSDGRRSED